MLVSAAPKFVPPHAARSAHLERTLGGGSGRNVIDRKDWSEEEDQAIIASVKVHGQKWRLVAADLPGRSDDAVRNRWKRIRERGDGGGAGSSEPAVKSHHKKRASDPTDAAEATERSSWSRKEDETILRSVNEYGHRWSRIAESLPGRSEHAIRNRYSRLQNLVHRGKPIVLGSGKGVPLGISLVPK